MYSVEFPKLGLDFVLNPVAFKIGTLEMRWYGIIIAVGFVLSLIYAFMRMKEFGIDSDRAIDVILGGAIGALVCARAYFVIFKWSDYASDPIKALYVWEGGLAIYGGLIGAFVFGLIFCKLRKVRILPMFDLAGAGFLLGQAIGRWGNFVNSEAFGSNTGLPWGMTGEKIVTYLTENKSVLNSMGITVDPNMPVHPTFLYESLWCLIGFILIAVYVKHRKFDGEIFLMYLCWYGFGRMLIEGLRTDSLMIGSIRVSQLLAAVLFIVSGIIILIVRSKIKRNNDPEYLKLYVNTEEAEMIRQGTFYKKKGKKTEELEIEQYEEDEEAADEIEQYDEAGADEPEDTEETSVETTEENTDETTEE